MSIKGMNSSPVILCWSLKLFTKELPVIMNSQKLSSFRNRQFFLKMLLMEADTGFALGLPVHSGDSGT